MNKIEEKLRELEERVSKLEKLSSRTEGGVVSTGAKKISVKEFLMARNASSEAQKVLILGYYLEHVLGMSSFNTTDIEVAFRSAKEKLPININATVNKNIERGFLMEAADKKESKKAWTLTSTGEKSVEETINS